MNNAITKITTIEAVCFVIVTIVNRIILNLPQLILQSCGSSSLLNIIFISVIAIIFTLILIKLFKNFSNSDIVDVSEFVGGQFLKNVIAVILILYLITFSSLLIRNFSEVIHSIYYSETSIFYLLAFFVVTAIISNFLAAKPIFKANVVIVLIMLLSLFVTFISVFPNIVWQRIFPILGNGASATFFYGLSNLCSFNGLMCLYFILPLLSEKKDFKKISIISVVLLSILLFLSTACLLLSLSFSINIKDISSIYTLITNNEFGTFLQHPESLFVFTWILSIMTYLNLTVLFIIRFSQKLINVKSSKLLILITCIIIFIIALLPQNILQVRDFENIIYKYLTTPLIFIIFPIILIIANIKFKKTHNSTTRKEQSHE